MKRSQVGEVAKIFHCLLHWVEDCEKLIPEDRLSTYKFLRAVREVGLAGSEAIAAYEGISKNNTAKRLKKAFKGNFIKSRKNPINPRTPGYFLSRKGRRWDREYQSLLDTQAEQLLSRFPTEAHQKIWQLLGQLSRWVPLD